MESKKWIPSRLRDNKLRLYTMHVRKWAMREVVMLAGPYNGNLLGAKIGSWFDEMKSVRPLRSRGVKLLGDA